MICVDCGKEKEIFREGSCLQCYLENHQFTHGPDILDIPYCVHCDSYKYKNLWYDDTLQDSIKRYIKKSFSISNELNDISFSINCDDEDTVKDCTIEIKGSIDHQQICESHKITVRIKNTVCDVCSKQFGGYHEAILQIRPGNRKISFDKLMKIQLFVEDQIIMMQQKNKHLFLSDMGREHGGLDFYVSDKQAAYTVIKNIQESYGGYITHSSKNVGMKDGRQIYRDTYLLRLLPFEQGDIIKYSDSYYFVEKVARNTIHLVHLDSFEKVIFEASDIENAVLMGNEELLQEMIVVSQNDEELQIMDPNTYHIMIVRKPQGMNIDSDTILIIFINEQKYYVHPTQNQK